MFVARANRRTRRGRGKRRGGRCRLRSGSWCGRGRRRGFGCGRLRYRCLRRYERCGRCRSGTRRNRRSWSRCARRRDRCRSRRGRCRSRRGRKGRSFGSDQSGCRRNDRLAAATRQHRHRQQDPCNYPNLPSWEQHDARNRAGKPWSGRDFGGKAETNKIRDHSWPSRITLKLAAALATTARTSLRTTRWPAAPPPVLPNSPILPPPG